MPLALVDELAFDLAHSGVGLGLGCESGHHALDVQVLDDEVLELVHQLSGQLVGGGFAQVGDPAVESVDATLCFPPAAGVGGTASLGALPAGEAFLGLVVSLGVCNCWLEYVAI